MYRAEYGDNESDLEQIVFKAEQLYGEVQKSVSSQLKLVMLVTDPEVSSNTLFRKASFEFASTDTGSLHSSPLSSSGGSIHSRNGRVAAADESDEDDFEIIESRRDVRRGSALVRSLST
jgi:hypothetical protein